MLERTWTFLEEIFIPEEIAKVTVAWTALLKDAQHADPNYPGGRDLFPDQPSSIKANWTEEVQSLVETIKHEYKRSLERTNPVYRPHIPDRKDIEKVFTCVKDCSEFLHDKGIKFYRLKERQTLTADDVKERKAWSWSSTIIA